MMPLAPIVVGVNALACVLFLLRRERWGWVALAIAVALSLTHMAVLWTTLHRPPLRTLGETRWWYATLAPLVGGLLARRFEARSLAAVSAGMGALFGTMNLAQPETMDRTLMPALQSPWFVPHVLVYMLAYAALSLASLIALIALVRWGVTKALPSPSESDLAHRLVVVGFPLLSCGLMFGAVWAKQAWGHYWAWDPKETWALLTWGAYLVYLHLRLKRTMSPVVNLSVLLVGYLVLLACWFGIYSMPSVVESVHTYTRTD